jgi:hypothetical protein
MPRLRPPASDPHGAPRASDDAPEITRKLHPLRRHHAALAPCPAPRSLRNSQQCPPRTPPSLRLRIAPSAERGHSYTQHVAAQADVLSHRSDFANALLQESAC